MRRLTDSDIERDLEQSSKPRYVPDLGSLLRTCEVNFLLIKQLIPEFNEGDVHQWLIDRAGADAQIAVEVKICSRYTVDLIIRQQLMLAIDGMPKALQWVVRLYQDARMAEVLTFQRIYARLGVNQYPNEAMLQRDEKAQANRFLREWLGHCAQHGRTSLSFFDLMRDANFSDES